MTSLVPYLLPVLSAPVLMEEQRIALSMVLIVLLYILLIEKEFIRAYGTMNIRTWLGTLNIFSWPLLAVFAFLIILRFIGFIIN